MKISVIVPAHNEKENLPPLINDLIALRDREQWDCELVIVDDNSSDNTGKIADEFSRKFENIRVIHREGGDNGMGFALREGTKKAKGDIIIWVMGDKSDDLSTIHRIINKLDSGFDMVLGSRYMEGGSRGDLSMEKAFLSSGYTLISRLIFGIPVHDITNAFRGFKKEIFSNIKLESGDFSISPEFSIKAHLKGYMLGEVPITYFNRRVGKTKFSMVKMAPRYVGLFKYRFGFFE